MARLPVAGPISQQFGANATANLPPDHPLIKQFGNYQPGGHTGTDFGVPEMTPIYAPADGVVVFSCMDRDLPGDNSATGWAARLYLLQDGGGYVTGIDHGNYWTTYSHQWGSDLNAGDRVTEGQLIGYSGNSGRLSTGPNLHWEVIPKPADWSAPMYGRVDPVRYIQQKGGGAVAFNLDGSSAALRKYGLRVIDEPGCMTRGFLHQDLQRYGGVMIHHTASNRASYTYNVWPSGNILVNGRSDLPGPLCNYSLDREGVLRFVATGVANHAGTGFPMGIVPKDMGNHFFIGLEIESSGVAPFDMTPAQMSTLIMFGAVMELTYGQSLAPADRLQVFHLEYSDAGKIDLYGWPGGPDGYRASANNMIAQIQRGGTIPTKSPTPTDPLEEIMNYYKNRADFEAWQRRMIDEQIAKAQVSLDARNLHLAVFQGYSLNGKAKHQPITAVLDRIDANLGPITRDGKQVSVRQEIADAKTLAGKIAADNVALTAQVAGLKAAIDALATAQGADPTIVTNTIQTAIDQALTGLTITRK